MKKEKTLRQSLFDSGVLEHGKQAIEAFKIEHQKRYKKEYNSEFRSRTIRKTLTYSEEEISFLKEEAKKHNMKLAPFIKLAAFSYLTQSFIFPDERSLSDIEKLLRNINNTVNQVIPFAAMQQNIDLKDLQELKDSIRSLEEFMRDKLENPSSLAEWLEERLAKEGEGFLAKLLQEISKHIS